MNERLGYWQKQLEEKLLQVVSAAFVTDCPYLYRLRTLSELDQTVGSLVQRIEQSKEIVIEPYGMLHGNGDTHVQVRKNAVVRDIADPVTASTYEKGSEEGVPYRLGPAFPGGMWGIVSMVAQSRLARSDAWGRPSLLAKAISLMPERLWQAVPTVVRYLLHPDKREQTFVLDLNTTNSRDYVYCTWDIEGIRVRFEHFYQNTLCLHSAFSGLPLQDFLAGPGSNERYREGSYFFGYPRFDPAGTMSVGKSSLFRDEQDSDFKERSLAMEIPFGSEKRRFGDVPYYPYVRYWQLPDERQGMPIQEVVVNFDPGTTIKPIIAAEQGGEVRRVVVDAWFGIQISYALGLDPEATYFPLVERRLAEMGGVGPFRRILVNR